MSIAAKADKRHAGAQHALGCLLLAQGEESSQKCAGCFRAAVETDPSHADAHFELGLLQQYGKKDVGGAIASFLASTDAQPRHARAHLAHAHRAALYEYQGEIDQAVGAWRSAEQIMRERRLKDDADEIARRSAKATRKLVEKHFRRALDERVKQLEAEEREQARLEELAAKKEVDARAGGKKKPGGRATTRF